jgi:hypothetical protein
VKPLVYAQHGHELMGWKSPVGEPLSMMDELHRCPSLRQIPYQFMYLTSTTSRAQGQTREGMSGGSLSAKLRADGQKRHRRPTFPWRAGTNSEASWFRGYGKWRGYASERSDKVPLGCSESSCPFTPQGGTDVWGDLTSLRWFATAPGPAMVRITCQKSADGIVAGSHRP